MTLKRFLLALLIAFTVLVFEFKVIPWVIKGIRQKNNPLLKPVQEVEKREAELVYQIKDGGWTILQGPFYQPRTRGVEFELLISSKKIKVVFSLDKEPLSQLASLQLILKESKIKQDSSGERPLKLIDLTGTKPYVAF